MEVLDGGEQNLFQWDRKLSELSEPVDSDALLYSTVRNASEISEIDWMFYFSRTVCTRGRTRKHLSPNNFCFFEKSAA
uniref:Uncharacterized protein n=1 Tax=Laticauda laticaudata TaxID=8630 RepID=A0A8C5RQP3_LATLA